MVFPTAFTVGNTLPVLVKVVCFSAFYIPLAIGLEWVQREQNMGMDVFLFLFRGVNGEIHAHPVLHKSGAVVLHQFDLFGALQLVRDGDLDLAGELGVAAFLYLFYAVPKSRTVCEGQRRVFGQQNLRMDDTAFSGIVMNDTVPFVGEFRSAAVCCGGNGGSALTAADDFDAAMIDRHEPSPVLRNYLK